MTESIHITPRTVAEWLARGFVFKQPSDIANSTEVTFQGKQFRFFPCSHVATTEDLLNSLYDEVTLTDNFVALGKFATDDPFPFFLITNESMELLKAARNRRIQALNDAERALGDFSDALFDPTGYLD